MKDHGKERNPERFEDLALKELDEMKLLLLFGHFLVKRVDDELGGVVVASSQPLEISHRLGNTAFRDQPPEVKDEEW